MRARLYVLIVLLAACGLAATSTAQPSHNVAVSSPNANVRLVLELGDGGRQVRYAVERGGQQVIEPSPIAVRLAELGSLGGLKLKRVEERSIDEWHDLPWGKTNRFHEHCRAAAVRLKAENGIEWDIELRAYDDGVAWRYGFPEQERLPELVIEEESSEFRLAGDPSILFMTLDNFTTSHEALYERKQLSKMPSNRMIEMPVLAVWPDGSAAAITEAALRDFAGMYLGRAEEARGGVLRTRLSPLPGRNDQLVAAKTPHWSPWRVVLLADRAGELIESNLLLSLNEPPEGDFSWLRPGKTTFPWWNGTVEHGPPSTPDVNFAVNKRFIDFCARHKIRYHSISSVSGNRPWFVQQGAGFADLPHEDTDILTPRPDIDLPRILKYARKKGVAIRLWVHWKPLSQHLEEAFAQYERWGIRGLMVDFMDRDDQEMVAWQEECLRAAARHKLHIQFHGSYKPTGEQRTYPNLFNREGVLNLEYLKWSDSCTPQHSVNVAYTRLLAGPVDFHLGGFRAVPREEFRPRDLRPVVMGTRANQLALYVVFENPMPMVADDPSAYEGELGFDFLIEVPTTWDETRFVAGEAGEYLVVARRSGDTWYLGGITNWTPRNVQLPLDFLPEGPFQAELYLDGSLRGESPNEIRQAQYGVTATDTIDVPFAPGGGIAAVFRPH